MNNNIQCSIESSTTSMELNSAADGIFLVPELEGLAGLPEIRTTSGVNAGYDGGWTSAQNYDARLIAIRGVIADKDIAKVEATRRKLASLLGQGRKEQLTLRFTTEAGNAYTISVRTISCEMALQRVLNKQDFLIQLRADDPLIYDDGASGGTEAILRVQQALGGFEINFGLPLAIGGSSDATAVENGAETVYPIIKLYGPLHSPTVVNMTTNQQMQIIADLGYTITWSGWTGVSGERLSIPNELDREAPLRLWSVDGNTIQDGTPTPDAPIPIETVTGRQTVTVTGKNLLPLIAGATTNGVTISIDENGYYKLNGTATADTTFAVALPSTLARGTYRTMSFNVIGGAITGTSTVRYRIRDANGSYSGGPDIAEITVSSNSTGRLTKVIRNELKTLNIWVANGCTCSNYTFTVQLENGQAATAYEPYRGQEYEINLGKNLIDYMSATYDSNGGAVSAVKGSDSITFTKTWSNRYAYSIMKLSLADSRNLYGKTVTVSYNKSATIANIDSGIRCFWGTETGTTIGDQLFANLTQTTGAQSVTLNVPATPPASDKPVLSFLFYPDNTNEAIASSSVLTISDFQIELGDQATDYSAYITPIELCKIGTYQDKIYKSGDKWYLHKEIGKVVLNGSESWTWQPSGGYGRAGLTPDGAYIYTDTTRHSSSVRSSHFSASTTNDYGIVFQYQEKTWFYPQATITTLADFKTWLGTALPSVYYALATPTTTEITNEEVLEGLEGLGGATLYVGANNIYTDTPGALPTLEVDYPTDYDETHDTVVIDSQARTITLNGADIYHLKTEESEFPVLAPGENRMYLTSATTSDTGYAEVKFKQGYLSI